LRILKSSFQRNPQQFDSKILLLPGNIHHPFEIPIYKINKDLLQNQFYKIIKQTQDWGSPEPKVKAAVGKQWYESLPDIQKQLATLILSGWHSALFLGSPGVGKSYFCQGLYGMHCDVMQALQPEKPAPLLVQPTSQVTPENLVFGYRSKNVSSHWDDCSQGILWLDELAEFKPKTLESLRTPMDGYGSEHCRIILATTNPCPCGFQNHSKISCHCRPVQLSNYKQRISGPLLDRINIGFIPENNAFTSGIKLAPSYDQQIALVILAQKKIWELSQTKLGSQWISSSSVEQLYQKIFSCEPLADRHMVVSRRRMIQIKRRCLSLYALEESHHHQNCIEEALLWDGQNIINQYWGTGPVLYANPNPNYQTHC